MSSIPIFDSLTHPTIDSNWILPKYPACASIEPLRQQMAEANIKWAFAVGIKGIGGYEEERYVEMIKETGNSNIFPIAFYHPDSNKSSAIREDLISIKKRGYSGIKLHPRISDFSITEHTSTIIKVANDLGLICMLCTYTYSSNNARKMSPELIMDMLSQTDGAKVILMHSGAVRLLEFMEIARVFKNILLDLSFTICKYEESSIDLDIKYMFNKFDQRICIGSDFPQFSLIDLRQRFEYFSEELPVEKLENIAYKNLLNFTKI